MLKETITYTDFNDEKQVEDLYFNITRSEMVDLLDIKPRLEAWLARAQSAGSTRDLTSSEIREMLDITKILIEKSYGQRSADGKRFSKSPQIFAEFKDSAAYDELVFGLFQDIDRLTRWISGTLPAIFADDPDFQAALAEAKDKATTTVVDIPMPEETEMTATEMEVPAYVREDRNPTQKELQNMSKEELQAAFAWKSKQ